MSIKTPAEIKALSVTFSKAFQAGIKLADSTYRDVAMVVPSSAASNVYAALGQFPQMKEWIGSRTLRDMAAQGYTLPNLKYESTVPVARTDLEDDNVGVYTPLFQMQGQESEQYPNRHVFGLLKVGESKLCYDGQNFFDTDHPVYPSVDGTGTPTPVSNFLAGSGADIGPAWYLMDTTKPLKPFIFQEREKPQITNKTSDNDSDHVFMEDEYLFGIRARSAVGFGLWQLCVKSTLPLTAENYEKAYQVLRNMKADGGDPLNVRPELLVVPSNLLPAAKTVVEKEFLAGGENNPNYGLSKVLDCAWLN